MRTIIELFLQNHYNDVIMGAIASQITSLTIVYSTVYSDADQRKHQSSASLAFVGTGEFPAQLASNVENVSIWWRLHAYLTTVDLEYVFAELTAFSRNLTSWNLPWNLRADGIEISNSIPAMQTISRHVMGNIDYMEPINMCNITKKYSQLWHERIWNVDIRY